MGPILQERTASVLKRVPVNENSTIVTSNSKTRGKVNQNLNPQKKSSPLNKNVISGKDKEPLPSAESNGQHRNRTKHTQSPNTGTCKMLHLQFEANIRRPRSKQSPSESEEKRQKLQHQSPCCTGVGQNCAAQEKSRHALSLPLAPHQVRLPENARDLEALHLLDHEGDDTDSASDLSDSERLPVLPSPCTPPQLKLRAEIVDSVDLHTHIPGMRTVQTESDVYNYPDFLPPPFNTWSLRQLSVFLNTEGKRAPRPEPVGQLEVFLERLLKLEWHQIQTIQNEKSQPAAANARSRSRASNYPQISSLSRAHTAPPTRLSSPKCMRQSQYPFPFQSSLGSPSSCQLSRCLYCHIRYPLCNSSCFSYTYQHHSRLSPLLERKTSPSITHKRSSSESRASDNGMARPHYPVSPKNQRKVCTNLPKAQALSMLGKKQHSDSKGHNGRAAEAENLKDPPVEEKTALDKRVVTSNKQEPNLAEKREPKEGQQLEIGSRGAMAVVKKMGSDNSSKSRCADRKLKHVHLSK